MDGDGKAILTNFPRRLTIHHFSFKSSISALSFSPSGRHFAVGVGKRVQIWRTPSTPGADSHGELEFAPFVLHRDLAGHFDAIQNITWSSDSRFFLTASKDLNARIWSLDPEDGFEPTTLAGHREGVVNAWFTEDQESVRFERNLSSFFQIGIANFSRSIHSVPMEPCSDGHMSLSLGMTMR